MSVYQSRVIKRRLVKERSVNYMGGKCQRCGIISPYMCIYDFHHKEDKKQGISVLINMDTPWTELKEELKKTILLCSNCHRIVTHEEREKWNEYINPTVDIYEYEYEYGYDYEDEDWWDDDNYSDI